MGNMLLLLLLLRRLHVLLGCLRSWLVGRLLAVRHRRLLRCLLHVLLGCLLHVLLGHLLHILLGHLLQVLLGRLLHVLLGHLLLLLLLLLLRNVRPSKEGVVWGGSIHSTIHGRRRHRLLLLLYDCSVGCGVHARHR